MGQENNFYWLERVSVVSASEKGVHHHHQHGDVCRYNGLWELWQIVHAAVASSMHCCLNGLFYLFCLVPSLTVSLLDVFGQPNAPDITKHR